MTRRLCPALVVISLCLGLALLTAGAQDIVNLGSGSYTTRLPDGAKAPPREIHRTMNARGPMPTNDWWSSLAWEPLSSAMYPHPLAVRAIEGGLRVYYPGASLTANDAAIFGFMGGDSDDFVIGHAAVEKFTAAPVDGWSDWFVSALFAHEAKKLTTTFGHGSPFVYVTTEGGDVALTFGKDVPIVWSGGKEDAVIGFTIKNRHYAAFAPTGSAWSGLETSQWTAHLGGKGYFAVAVLPDKQLETLALFRRYAHNHVTDSRVAWRYDEIRAVVRTTFTFVTRAYEGESVGTLFALYPHQWLNTTTPLTEFVYGSVRGVMKVAAGESFTTDMIYPGVLPSLPLVKGLDSQKMESFLDQALAETARSVSDTYSLGKQLGKWATLIPLAEQQGRTAQASEFRIRVKAALENFFNASEAGGSPKKSDGGVFHYDGNWGTLIGYPASYDSDVQLNDHHFHYGYFIRAAGELARRDPLWANDANWGGMVKLLIREIASPDRTDPLFPFLRCFDPYAGHSWASGHAKFGDGNNNESSSEAVNAWFGIILFGEAVGDKTVRDLGVWLLTTEIEAINHYWFDVTAQFHHPEYNPSVVTMVWGGKGANGTWFSANPELVHGINWLPFTGASLYLGRYPDYCSKNYAALLAENAADNAKKGFVAGERAGNFDGTMLDQWADLVWMYRALTDPVEAMARFDGRKADFKPEDGNSLANTFSWLGAFAAYGRVEKNITADTPFYAVFKKNGQTTHIAYNYSAQPRTVMFSDHTAVVCPPHSFGMKERRTAPPGRP